MADERSIVDLKLECGDKLLAIVESKIGRSFIEMEQAMNYARLASFADVADRSIIFITQTSLPRVQASIQEAVAKSFPDVRITFVRWQEIFALVEGELCLTAREMEALSRRVAKGLTVPSH